MSFICPICKSTLLDDKDALYCEQKHRFDKSKEGYVNLLLSQKSRKKRHGDDKIMIRARSEFLLAGYYGFLLQKLTELSRKYISRDNVTILDAGCGECYYSASLKKALQYKNCRVYAIDISKNAAAISAKNNPDISVAVAGVNKLPIESGSVDIVLNVFAPFCAEEFTRVLSPGGIILQVQPMEMHLWELKAAIYDEPYLNRPKAPQAPELVCAENIHLQKTLHIPCAEDIGNLFKMTPYYYKTSVQDQQKLASLGELTVQADFGITVLKKDFSN